MTADEALIVYMRRDCHLCELAISMLRQAEIDFRLVDIDTNPELTRRYDIHVPVLAHPGSGNELFFPFNEQQIRSFTGMD